MCSHITCMSGFCWVTTKTRSTAVHLWRKRCWWRCGRLTHSQGSSLFDRRYSQTLWSSRVSGLVWIFRKNNNTAALLVKRNITFSCGLYCSFMPGNKLLTTAFISDSIPWHVTACKLDDEPIHSWAKKTPAFLPPYYLTVLVQDKKLWDNTNTCGYTNKNTVGFLNIPSHLIHNSFLFCGEKKKLLKYSKTCRQCELNAKSQEW